MTSTSVMMALSAVGRISLDYERLHIIVPGRTRPELMTLPWGDISLGEHFARPGVFRF